MADELSNEEVTETTATVQSQSPNESEDKQSVDELPSWAQTMIRELRSESAERRVALKNLEEQARLREQERLAEQGKWKELAESRANELNELAPYRERADTLEGMMRESNKSRIETIPEDMRPLVPTDYAPEKLSKWLDANLSKLSKPFAPRLDGGASGGGGVTVSLTEEEKAVARASGISLDDYAKYKQRIQGGFGG